MAKVEGDAIPVVEEYRGVGIHDFQPRERIDAVVRPAIDAVFALGDPDSLMVYCREPAHPPEARILAAARCEALWELAAENREIRPRVDRTQLRALTAGLDSLRWIDPWHYGALLQPGPMPGRALPAPDVGERERLRVMR